MTFKKRIVAKLKSGDETTKCTLYLKNKHMNDEEKITFLSSDFVYKAEYIDKAYTDELVLKACPDIMITCVKFETHLVGHLHNPHA